MQFNKHIFSAVLLSALLITVSCGKANRRPINNPTPSGDLGTGTGTWLEVCSSDFDYNGGVKLSTVTHRYTTYSGVVRRNYTLGYYNAKKIAIWVAYPLCGFHMSGPKRSDDWTHYDPEISTDDQLNMSKYYSSYGISGYDRGHQIPSADRMEASPLPWAPGEPDKSLANVQTFYYSNMTAQIKSFNQQIWAKLEGRVRSLASACDTLYVVTGCDIKTSTKKVGNTTQPIPGGYYKALLAYKRPDKYEAMGFYFVHQENDAFPDRVWKNYAMSIDDLEEKIGIDFFVYLPEKVGEEAAAAIEAVTPDEASSFWF